MNEQQDSGQGEFGSEATLESQARPNAAELRLAQLDAANKGGEGLPAELVGRYQAELGQEWAAVYSDKSQAVPPASAEMVLRNPQVYLHDSKIVSSLPPELQEGWARVVNYADVLATRGAQPREWSEHTNGLDKLHSLVEAGEMSGDYRGAVGDVMRASSDLFAQSVMRQPGNLRYFQGNVLGAASSIERFRKK